MLTLILLCLVAVAKGQHPYPPAAPYPPAIKVVQPVTHVVQPVLSGRLQAIHFRSGPNPPAEPLLQVPPSVGPYPPALHAPTSYGLPALLSIEGGEISPVEQDSPRVDHTAYNLPSLSRPGQLQNPTQSYPLQLEHNSPPISYPSHYPQSPDHVALQPEQSKGVPVLSPTQYTSEYPIPYAKVPNQLGNSAPLYPTPPIPSQPHPTQLYPFTPNQSLLQPNKLGNVPASYPTPFAAQSPITIPKSPTQFGVFAPTHPTPSIPAQPHLIQSHPLTPNGVSPISLYPSQPSHLEKPPSSGTPSIPQAGPEQILSGGEVSPDELEIPPNSQIKLQDNRLQYSHGFSDDKGTAVREQGSLLSTNDGWEYVIAKKGSYSYTSPEGKLINVNYIADHNGYRVIP